MVSSGLSSEVVGHLGAVVDRLSVEFAGVFSRETIARNVDESMDRWSDGTVFA